jgi:hypothetical protein
MKKIAFMPVKQPPAWKETYIYRLRGASAIQVSTTTGQPHSPETGPGYMPQRQRFTGFIPAEKPRLVELFHKILLETPRLIRITMRKNPTNQAA